MKLQELASIIEEQKADFLKDKGYEANTLFMSRIDYELIDTSDTTGDMSICGLKLCVDNHQEAGVVYLYKYEEPKYNPMYQVEYLDTECTIVSDNIWRTTH